MLKKLPLKNIFIVFTAMLVLPVMAFAMTTTVNPSDEPETQNRDINITSDEEVLDGTTNASPLITSDGTQGPDGVTNATGDPQNQGDQSGPDAVSSATGVSDGNGDDSDSDYEDDDEDEDHDVIKDEDDDEKDDEDDDEEDDEDDD